MKFGMMLDDDHMLRISCEISFVVWKL